MRININFIKILIIKSTTTFSSRFFTIVVLLCSQLNVSGQGWIWQRPKQQGNTLNDVFFLNQDKIWAVGEFGTVMKSSDGGQTWTVLKNNIDYSLTAISFTNENNGCLIGYNKIYRTVNGGNDWTEINNPTGEILNDIFFLNDNVGWISGNWGTFLKTTDGGLTWTPIGMPTYKAINKIRFFNENEGIISMYQDNVMLTTNGGITWTTINVKSNSGIGNIEFINRYTGWICLANGTLAKTTDGGFSWSMIYTNTSLGITYSHFFDLQKGIVFYEYGGIGRTNDGGNTWVNFFPTYVVGNSTAFWGSRGCSVGYNGNTLVTNDSAENWQTIIDGKPTNLNNIDFYDNNYGWAVGSTLFKTINGGKDWVETNTTGSFGYSDIVIFNNNKLMLAGSNGKIAKTTDSGASWIMQATNTFQNLNGIFFINENIGWSVGESGTILKTNDGGTTWMNQTSGTNATLFKVKFIDSNIGWIVGGNNIILKTLDGGNTWTRQASNASGTYFYNFFIKDASNLFVVGNNKLLRTTNGGLTWSEQNLNGFYSILRNIYFWDNNNGMITGGDAFFKTTDGGNTWVKQNLKISGEFWGIKFNDSSNGWISSGLGGILKYWDGQLTINLEDITICPNTTVNLILNNCPSTVTWSNGMIGSSIIVTPTISQQFVANCAAGGSKTSNISIAAENLDLQDNYTVSKDFQAINHINARSIIGDGDINTTTKVKFYAGKSVILENGFSVNRNATFTAEIKSCN